ncbi:HAD-IIIC family phosphatase [Micromonospora eburnea]|uniref:D-glyceryl-ACP synthase n=1 Tax=Micromonospora eburnea TaxID=227316 RepID=A0A1C6V112_9ACTN|nr:HAD-IIIC family phosphatase [Micromonospora eburnea]SCL59995.1 D-glyceryl-ACP synthase [Micromonospora eburnea]
MTAMDEFIALHRAGTLLDDYPRATALARELSDPDLLRAGRLLAALDQERLRAAHPEVSTVTVAVTGHGTLPDLVAALTAELARRHLLLVPYAGQFDGYLLELSDPDSRLHAGRPDLIACVLDPAVITDEVPVPWRVDDVEKVLDAKLGVLTGLVDRVAEIGSGTLLLNTIPLPREFRAQLVDQRSRARLGAAWRRFNAALLELSETRPGLVVLDLDPLVGTGLPIAEPRLEVYAKVHLSPQLLAGYAREVADVAALLAGRTRKCLVVDLDGTLWGGILGDDGVDGIEIGDTRRGEAFERFQRVVKQIASQGVLLAVVSKNDPGPVDEALRRRDGMVLRDTDFVQVIANWRPKHDNLKALAKTLNVGTDSLVFVDDSAYECGLVRRELPEVAVIQVDGEPAGHVAAMLRDGWFTVHELTEADRKRSGSYRAELDRTDFLQSFDSLEDYLRELGVRVVLADATEADVPRVSQLTLRTNQFNLVTERLQPADVRELIAGPATRVLTIRSGDRFGDNGLVGAVFLRRDGTETHIDNFVLSCRVFGRGIEQACLAAVLRQARDGRTSAVRARFRPSAKNGNMRDFYGRHGFAAATHAPDGSIEFVHDLRVLPEIPGHLFMADS